MSIQTKINKSHKGYIKQYQLLQFAEQLKRQIKKAKSKYPNILQWQHIYKHFKQLIIIINQLVNTNQHLLSDLNQGQLPQFFQSLHQTTVDMRMKLLADLGRQENRRRKMQQQYIAERDELKKQLQIKKQKIVSLQAQSGICKNASSVKVQTINSGNQEGIQELIKQKKKLMSQNRNLSQKISKMFQAEKALKSQLKKYKQCQQDPYQNIKKSSQKKTINRKKPPLPDEQNSVKTSYENVLGSFSQFPNLQNYTEFDNTDSQQSDRKVKSVQSPVQNLRQIYAEQFWRFLVIQASTIEEIIRTNQ